MKTFRVEAPDGRTLTVQGDDPEGAAQAAEEYIRANPNPGKSMAVPAPPHQDMLSLMTAPATGKGGVPRAAYTGVKQGVTALPGALGDLTNAWGKGVDWVAEHTMGAAQDATGSNLGAAYMGSKKPHAPMPQTNYAHLNGIGDSADANAVRQLKFGADYQPQNTAEEYARTIGQFAPGALVPGGLATRAAAVVLPGVLSEAAGQATKGSPYEGVARLAGGMLGGAYAPGAVEGLSALPQRMATRAAIKPDLRVARALDTAAQRDQIPPVALVAKAQANPTAPAFHAGGENVAGLAEIVAQSPGPGRQTLVEAVRQHQGAVPDQIKADIGSALGGKGDFFATLDKTMEARKAAALPFRDASFKAPLDPVEYEQKLAPIVSRVPQPALNFAARLAELDGRNPNEIGLMTQRMPGGGSIDVRVEHPTMETLHYIKKGMDQDLNQFRDGLGRLDLEGQPLAAAASKVRSSLGKTMREVDPNYDKFMQTWGDESQHVDALRLGRNVFSPTPEMGFEQLSKKVGDMNPTSQDMYRKGVGEALIAQVRSQKGGVGTMRQLLRSEEFRDRVSLAFPDRQAYDKFVESAATRVREQDRNSQVIGNSRTFGRAAAARDLEAQPGMHPADVAGAGIDLATLNIPSLTGKSLKLALKGLPRKDRSIIGDAQTNQLLASALKSPDEMDRLMKLLQAPRPAGLFGGGMPQPSLLGASTGGLLANPR